MSTEFASIYKKNNKSFIQIGNWISRSNKTFTELNMNSVSIEHNDGKRDYIELG